MDVFPSKLSSQISEEAALEGDLSPASGGVRFALQGGRPKSGW